MLLGLEKRFLVGLSVILYSNERSLISLPDFIVKPQEDGTKKGTRDYTKCIVQHISRTWVCHVV